MGEANEATRLYVAKAAPLVETVKVLDAAQGVVRVLVSTEHRDRDGDIVRQKGMDTRNYLKNGAPVFWGHESRGLPIARTVKLKREKLADGVWGTWAEPKFATDIQGFSLPNIVRDLVLAQFAGASSIGFIPFELADLPDGALTEAELAARKSGQRVWGRDIKSSEMVEWSFVGIPCNPGVDVERNEFDPDVARQMIEVARKHVGGGAELDEFRRMVLGKQAPICIGCMPVEKAPERVRDYVAKAVAPEPLEDDGFDLSEKAATAAPAAKAADPEPEDTDPPVAPVAAPKAGAAPVAKQLDEATAAALETRLSALAGSIGALAGILEATVSRLTAACASMEACCSRMESASEVDDAGDGAAPMSMASFAAEVRKTLADHAAQVERIQVEVWSLEQRKALDAPKMKSCGCTKAAPTAPAEATPDPAPVAKDANTPASAEVPPSPSTDPGLMERVLRAGFTAGREKHLGIVRL